MALASLVYLFPIITLDVWYAVILFVIKLATTGAFASVFFGTNALFREDLVAIIFAICNMFARLISMAAPIVSLYQDTTVMSVFFALSIMGLMCTGFISEKKKKRKKRSRKHKEEAWYIFIFTLNVIRKGNTQGDQMNRLPRLSIVANLVPRGCHSQATTAVLCTFS